MIAHVVEFEAPADVLEGIGMSEFQTRVVPVLEQQPGFEGCQILINRAKGRLLGITLWDTEENGRLAGARLEQERRTGAEQMSAASPLPDLYDVIAHRQETAMHALVFEVAMKPGIDPTVANAELDKMIGQVKTLPGFVRGIWTTDGTTGLSFQLYADENVARQLVDNATVPPGSTVEFRSARMFAVVRDTAGPA